MNTFEVGQEVFVTDDHGKNKVVIDMEIIDNQYIYYMDDKSCYPENKVFLNQCHCVYDFFKNSSVQDRDQIFNQWFQELSEKINTKQTDPTSSRKRPLLSSLFDFLRRGF